jgi:uncharacterized protein DUF2188
MPDITVHRHGDRWAVKEPGAESPAKEFPSREAAELAARQMAAGGSVQVVEDDPTGLADAQDHDAGQAEPPDPKISAGDPAERSREQQAGL